MNHRTVCLALLAALALPIALPARAADHDHHAGHGAAAESTALGKGVVRKVDKAGGKLTVAHDALPNGMPAMTMAFKVKDKALLDQVKEGQTIRFATADIDGATTIIRLEPAR